MWESRLSLSACYKFQLRRPVFNCRFCATTGCFMFNVESTVGLSADHFDMAIESLVANAITDLLAKEDRATSVFFDVGMNSG